MNRVIHKYPLEVQDEPQEISVSINYKQLHFDVQNGAPTLWVSNTPGSVKQELMVYCFGTGQQYPAYLKHIGTVQIDGFVWHYFIA